MLDTINEAVKKAGIYKPDISYIGDEIKSAAGNIDTQPMVSIAQSLVAIARLMYIEELRKRRML